MGLFARWTQALPTVVWTDAASTGSATSPHTFTSIDIGTALATRDVFVAVNNGIASAVTVGGVSATLVETAASGGLTLWRASVPTGATASIVVTYTSGGGRLLISVWAAYNILNTTPFDTANALTSSTPATNHSVTIDTAAGGIVIAAAATIVNAGDGGPSWSGTTLRDTEALSTGPTDFILSSASSENTAGASGATLQTTWSPAIGNVAIVAATFL